MNILINDEVDNKLGFLQTKELPVIYNGYRYNSWQQLFQTLRFYPNSQAQHLIRKSRRLQILNKVVMIKRHVLNRGEKWNEAKEDLRLMKMCVKLLLEQHPDCKEQLVKTGSATLIKDNTGSERNSPLFWGMILKDGNWIGKNHFGKICMEIREEIQKSDWFKFLPMTEINYTPKEIPTSE